MSEPRRNLRSLAKTVLAHPVVMRLKPRLRSVWWTLKGRGVENPPLPDRLTSVLFVCLGNICRSPFASELAKRLLRDLGRVDVLCSSAGIRPSQDHRSPDEACRVSLTYGVSLDDHVPRALTSEMMASHDMVVVMEHSQFVQLRAAYPARRDRIFLLSLFDDAARNAFERFNIADPFGKPLLVYQECYTRIDRALRRCLAGEDKGTKRKIVG
jgi:protein-tyrosine phosphatase